MLTYISRRNPEIIRQMEVQDLSMETVLQEYYQVISRAVSYTHLDVYKRQVRERMKFLKKRYGWWQVRDAVLESGYWTILQRYL